MARQKSNRRNMLVIFGLLLSLSLTSALLLALAPNPMLPQPKSLLVLDQTPSLDSIFDTKQPLHRWQHIYIHHSKSRRQPSASTGDHFLITGPLDGDIQIKIDPRWTNQLAATPNTAIVSPTCISICIVGDFTQANPTPAQQAALRQLLQSLQSRLSIPHKNILTSPTRLRP